MKILTLTQLGKAAFQKYVDWRRGNRPAEKRCYKTTDTILLTFDDYASADQTNRLIDILAAAKVRAMFFFQGDWAIDHSDLIEQFREAGHIIGNHTFSHQDLRTLTDEQVTSEVNRQPVAQPWFRPPYGSYDRRVRSILAGLGYVICYWSVDSYDWAEGATSKSIFDRVTSRLHPGAVILLHAHRDATIEILPELIAEIRRQGYQLDTFSDPAWSPKA